MFELGWTGLGLGLCCLGLGLDNYPVTPWIIFLEDQREGKVKTVQMKMHEFEQKKIHL